LALTAVTETVVIDSQTIFTTLNQFKESLRSYVATNAEIPYKNNYMCKKINFINLKYLKISKTNFLR
jgi:methionyl-tRNA synthetase